MSAENMVHKMENVKLLNNHGSVTSQESIEMEEYSDEEDEVFVRGSGGSRKDIESSRNGVSKHRKATRRIANDDDDDEDTREASRPLMKKKKKKRQNGELHATIRTSKPKYRKCCGPLCCAFLAFKTLLGTLVLTIFLVNYFTHTSWMFWKWWWPGYSSRGINVEYGPCHDLEIIPVWQKKLPKFTSESNIRLVNITNDDVLDIVLGFGTGADGYNVPDFICDIYFNNGGKKGVQKPCFGGIIALDGRTGKILWTRWADHKIFAVTCQADLNNDTITDCVAGGMSGVFFAVNGKNGKLLWEFSDKMLQTDLMSVYVAQVLNDVNGDHIPDILAVHGGDEVSDPAQEEKMFGRIIIFSGKTGKILSWMQAPDRREIYYPPQILYGLDGDQSILFGTGGSERSGALYVISVTDLLERDVSKALPIYRDEKKGMLTPAALVDINNDSVADIVIATFNSHVIAFDGLTYRQIWNTSFAGSESYSTIGVGYYDRDYVPDFIVKYLHGPGYPVYEYEQTVVLSGKDGSKISPMFTDSIGSQSSPLSLSVSGRGNDIFLHWMSNCKGHDKERLKYGFSEGENVHDMMRADVCGSLFDGAPQQATLTAMQRYNATKEITIYDSLWWDNFEHSNYTDTMKMAEQYAYRYPELQSQYEKAFQAQNENEEDDDRYSVLPYYNQEHDDALALLEREMARAAAAGDDIMLNDQNGDDEQNSIEDSQGMEENENDVDPVSVDYMEGGEVADKQKSLARNSKSNLGEEVIPSNVVYSQPHKIQKLPNELSPGQMDSFERPYVRGIQNVINPSHHSNYATGKIMNYPSGNVQNYPGLQQNVMPGPPVYLPPGSINYPPGNYPQYPGNAPYPSGGSAYGFIKNRNKRQTSQSKASNKSSKKYKNKNEEDDSKDKAHWGVHRILSTGTLAPPILAAKDSMDLIFSTHWVYPARIPVLQPIDKKCIKDQIIRTDRDDLTESEVYDITLQCLKRLQHLPRKGIHYETPSNYEPFAVNMGQMTVYRFTIRCKCKKELLTSVETDDGSTQNQQCPYFLPYKDQGWPSYMGIEGDSKFNPRAELKRRQMKDSNNHRR